MKDATLLNLLPALPEMFVALMACVTLLVGVFNENRHRLPYYFAQGTVIIAAVLTWFVFIKLDAAAIVLTFHDTFVLDKFAVVLKVFIYIAVFFSLLYSRDYNHDRHMPATEYYVLSLLSMTGMMVLVSAHNFLTLFLGLELMSLPIYAMVALSRGKARCIEAAMKYFVIGTLATGLLLYGMSMIFGATKSLDLTQVAAVIKAMPTQQDMILIFGMVFIVSALAFKLGAAPFHMWVPDVYDGAPTSVTLFLGTAPKIAAFGLLIRLLVDAMPALHLQWQHIWIVVALLSMAIGNLVAIVQSNIKRMLAYSSIAHMGYMVLGIVCATTRGYTASLFYIITYTIMTLGSFGMVILLSRAGFEANDVQDFAGLHYRNPWLALVMMLVMFSLASVPPIVGFIAKVGVLEALIQVHLVWLAVVALLFSIIGAYYYIRVVKVMYFEEPLHAQNPVVYPVSMKIAITVNGFAVLLMGIFPGWLFELSHVTF